ncbi:MAG TPA: glycosyltransferase family 9 protein [Thermoguttaceae bacterium]|nr:glycosyltransferase family 9 protein [Thermoguttaceae bacterium]
MQPNASPRILIVRLSAIGDTVHGMPVLCALRERFPAAHLSWVVERRAAALLRGHAALDELIELPRGWLRSPREVLGLRRRLRKLQPEVTIDLQGLTKSAIVARLSSARRRIGFGDEKGRELSRWLNNELVHAPAAHVIDANLQLLGPLGVTSPAVRFDVPETPEDARNIEAMIARAGVGGRFALINPGAGWPSKLWPPSRFAAVAEYLGRRHGIKSLVVWAGNEEHVWADAIAAGSGGHAQTAPPTSLTELAALCRRASLFIASDTGPLHIAAAVGTPCVGLYGPMPAARNGPYGPRHMAIQKCDDFHGTSRQRRNAPAALMEVIEVDDVCRACDAILK